MGHLSRPSGTQKEKSLTIRYETFSASGPDNSGHSILAIHCLIWGRERSDRFGKTTRDKLPSGNDDDSHQAASLLITLEMCAPSDLSTLLNGAGC